MSTLSIRLPDSLHRMAKNIAAEDHVSMNQFIASVVAEKVSALTNETYLKERAQRASADKFKAALAAVPDSEPEDFDRRGGGILPTQSQRCDPQHRAAIRSLPLRIPPNSGRSPALTWPKGADLDPGWLHDELRDKNLWSVPF